MDNPTLERIEIDENHEWFTVINGCLYDKNVTILYCLPPLTKNFKFPLTVKKVHARSIYLPNTTELWLPPSVSIIESTSFFRVPKLEKLHILGNIQKIGTDLFKETSTKLDIYYRGQKKVTTENVTTIKTLDVTAFVCDQYEGTTFSNLPTKRQGFCYQIFIYKTILKCPINIQPELFVFIYYFST